VLVDDTLSTALADDESLFEPQPAISMVSDAAQAARAKNEDLRDEFTDGHATAAHGRRLRWRPQHAGVPPICRWYTFVMPTSRPRYQVTETPEVARALDRAAERWPGVPRSRLLVLLVELAGGLLADDEHANESSHRSAVLASAGRYAEAFGPDYLADLRTDWPA
jgi:hypothetical protein